MIAFFCALPHDQSSNVIDSLEKYLDPLAPYLVALETSSNSHQDTSGEHYHFCCSMNSLQYDAFRKTIFVKKYGLNGQARNGKARQYGKVRNIRDETKMLTYTVKDKNIYYKNYDLSFIQEILQNSFPKIERRDLREEIMEYLANIDKTQYLPNLVEYIQDLEVNIIKFFRINKETYSFKVPTKNYIKYLVVYYLMYYTTQDDEFILFYLRDS